MFSSIRDAMSKSARVRAALRTPQHVVIDGRTLFPEPGANVVAAPCGVCEKKGDSCPRQNLMTRIVTVIGPNMNELPSLMKTQFMLEFMRLTQVSASWLIQNFYLNADAADYERALDYLLDQEWKTSSQCWRVGSFLGIITQVAGVIGASRMISVLQKRTLITVVLFAEVVARTAPCCCSKWLDSSVPSIVALCLRRGLLDVEFSSEDEMLNRQAEFDDFVWREIFDTLDEPGTSVTYPTSGKSRKVAERFHIKRQIGNAIAGPIWMDAFDIDQADLAVKANQVKTMYLHYLDADTIYVPERVPSDINDIVLIVQSENLLQRAWVRQELILSNTYSIVGAIGEKSLRATSLAWILLLNTIENNYNDTEDGEEALFLRMLLQKSKGISNIGEVMRESQCYFSEDRIVAAANVLRIEIPDFTYGEGFGSLFARVLNTTKSTFILEGYLNLCTSVDHESDVDESAEFQWSLIAFRASRLNIPAGITLYSLDSFSLEKGIQLQTQTHISISDPLRKKANAGKNFTNRACLINGVAVHDHLSLALLSIKAPVDLAEIAQQVEGELWSTLLIGENSMAEGSWLLTVGKSVAGGGELVHLPLKDAGTIKFGILIEMNEEIGETTKGVCVGGWWSSGFELVEWEQKLEIFGMI
ncbi:hypothetical protein HDU84_006054 [Entophlyctis sp. JEL0112]|nr:hypothetical protein HDU84_006054 [Entophlyctis sp. JEL0112]